MAEFGFDFDASQVDTSSYSELHEGQYVAVINKAERKPTKRGDAEYLSLEFQIVSDHQNGRKLWQNLNLWNANQDAVKIAFASLASICKAVGVLKPTDTDQLVNKPMRITIKHKLDKSSGEVQARISKFEPTTPQTSTPQAPTQYAPPIPTAPTRQQPAPYQSTPYQATPLQGSQPQREKAPWER
jgi:hypothetical protein